MSNDSKVVWNAAKALAGQKMSGSPNKLNIHGRVENSPSKISEILNLNFIKKIDDIRT